MARVPSVISAVVASCKVNSVIRRAIGRSYCKIMGDYSRDTVMAVPLDIQVDVGYKEVNDMNDVVVNGV